MFSQAWRQGQTGYPLVDAAMRQLWSSGWCHNRARVVAASFLVKDLLLPWQWGLKHYWDAQIDADLECDALGWQYVSGGMSGGWSAAWCRSATWNPCCAIYMQPGRRLSRCMLGCLASTAHTGWFRSSQSM